MDNQHKFIKGYRDLTAEEVALMNRVKALAEECGGLLLELAEEDTTDKRSLDIAQTNLQQGFMWAIRSIAKPTTFG